MKSNNPLRYKITKKALFPIITLLLLCSCSNSNDNSGIDPLPKDSIYLLSLDQANIDIAIGVDIIIGNMYIGSCSLAQYLRNAENNSNSYSYRKIGNENEIYPKMGQIMQLRIQTM